MFALFLEEIIFVKCNVKYTYVYIYVYMYIILIDTELSMPSNCEKVS